uniref:Uncharacterized protein n=1 Tax=Meloidogyne enterolobii TaxID=390850 RepID=A0A6V7WKF2_MELEN|nr:unnamed protein product [Meloidogyne enterolobii]
MVSLFFLVQFHSFYLWHIQMRTDKNTHTRTDKTRVFSVRVCLCLSVRVRPSFVCLCVDTKRKQETLESINCLY